MNTSITSLIPVVAMLLFGGETLKDFALAMTIGLVCGCYSSIAIATPLYCIWKEREPRNARLVRKYGKDVRRFFLNRLEAAPVAAAAGEAPAVAAQAKQTASKGAADAANASASASASGEASDGATAHAQGAESGASAQAGEDSKPAASGKSQGSRKPAKGSTRRSNHHYGKKKK